MTSYRPKDPEMARSDEEDFLLVESNPSTIVERFGSRDFSGNVRGLG